jgi:DNA-binding transcriptional regulator YiaG
MSSNKMIPVEESFAEWRKDPNYVKAYNALEDEFSLAAEMIKARASAGLTQEQLAQRMNTTQAVIARLESGRVKPSTAPAQTKSVVSCRSRRRAVRASGSIGTGGIAPKPAPERAQKSTIGAATRPMSTSAARQRHAPSVRNGGIRPSARAKAEGFCEIVGGSAELVSTLRKRVPNPT